MIWILLIIPAHAGTMLNCINEKGMTFFTDAECPSGYVLQRSETSEGQGTLLSTKLGVTFQVIDMYWYLSRSSLQKESLYEPQIELTIRNDSKEPRRLLTIKAVFLEDANKVFGDTTELISDLPPGRTSATIFMRPGVGLEYNGYNGEAIMRKTFQVEIFAEGEKIGSIYFFSQRTR
jgi:hypothetical protein